MRNTASTILYCTGSLSASIIALLLAQDLKRKIIWWGIAGILVGAISCTNPVDKPPSQRFIHTAVEVGWHTEYMEKLPRRAKSVIESWSKGIDTSRPPRLQGKLLGGAIKWANPSISDKSKHLCIAIALELAKQRAMNELSKPESLKPNYLIRLEVFLTMVDEVIDSHREKTKGIKDSHIRRLSLDP